MHLELFFRWTPKKSAVFELPISPQILHPKTNKFHQLVSFTKFLNVYSQFVSSVLSPLLMRKNVNDDVS